MEIILESNESELYRKAALAIKKCLDSVLEKKEIAVFGIPGGRSASGVFNELRKLEIDWKKVHIFMADERMVPAEDNDNNFRIAKEAFIDEFLEKGIIASSNVHPFAFENGRENAGVSAYNEELDKRGGKINVIFLSAGEDGHVASLFPNHSSIKDDSPSFILVEDSPKLPPKRISASGKLLEKSECAVILFKGSSKKDAYKNFLDENKTVNECPAKIAGNIKNSYVFTDISLKA